MMNQNLAPDPNDPVADEARSALDASWNALLTALESIPETDLDRPGVCGDWSLRTLFGHIAFWDRFSLNRARNALAGNPPLDVDADPLNEADARSHAGRTAADNRASMMAAHVEMLAFIADVDPLSPRFVEMLRQMSVDTNQHYDEHASQIRAWRAKSSV